MTTPSIPERPAWQRPPFEPGHMLSTVHGARSPRFVDPLSAEIAADLLALPDLPQHLHRPEFGPAVAAWARAEARCELMAGWLAKQDTTEPTDRAVAVLRELHRAESAAAKLRGDLGLTPMAAARLSRDLSASRLMAGQAMAGIDKLAAAGAELAARDLTAIEAARGAAAVEEGGSDADDQA